MALRGEAEVKTYVNLAPVRTGSSEVFHAYHRLFEGPVIQKTVRLSTVPDAVAATEPMILNELEHPALPKVREAQFDPERRDCITFVMQVVGDIDIGDELLAKRSFSVVETTAIALDVLSALAYLHSKGIVMRDVKPDNVRTDTHRRRGWLIDLNLAGRLDAARTVQAIATPTQYMAPEVPSTLRYTVQSELYSLGLVLFEMLRGQVLYDGIDMARIERRVTEGRRGYTDATLNTWPPHVPEALRRVLRKALRVQPGNRFNSARDMKRALVRQALVDWSPGTEENGTVTHVGTWPGNRVEGTTDIRVIVRQMTGGPSRGRRRAIAQYRATGDSGWRRLSGVRDLDFDFESELSQFFDDVDARIAQLRPVR
jgi:eukaryotic-like serine/threonine-protein kinase